MKNEPSTPSEPSFLFGKIILGIFIGSIALAALGGIINRPVHYHESPLYQSLSDEQKKSHDELMALGQRDPKVKENENAAAFRRLCIADGGTSC